MYEIESKLLHILPGDTLVSMRRVRENPNENDGGACRTGLENVFVISYGVKPQKVHGGNFGGTF